MKITSAAIKAGMHLSLSVVFWASAFVGIRIGISSYTPGCLALLRFLIASLGMLVIYIFFSKRTIPALKDWPLIFFMGVTGFSVYNITLNSGELSVTSGIASFILSQMPVVVMLLAAFLLKEKITKTALIGVLISVIGVALVAISHHSNAAQAIHFDPGMVYLCIAVGCGALYAVCYKSLAHKYHPLELTAFAVWSGTILLLVYTPALWREVQTANVHATLAAVYLGIFPTIVGYSAWSYVLRYMPASRASNYLFLMPLVATLLGWLLLGEVPEMLALCGGLIALVGAMIATQFNKKQKLACMHAEST